MAHVQDEVNPHIIRMLESTVSLDARHMLLKCYSNNSHGFKANIAYVSLLKSNFRHGTFDVWVVCRN